MTSNRRRNKFWKWAARKGVAVSFEQVLRWDLAYKGGHWPCLYKTIPLNFKQNEYTGDYTVRTRRKQL